MLARLLTIRTLATLLLAVPATLVPSRSAQAQSKEAEDASDEGGEGSEEDPAKPDPDQPIVEAGGNYSQDRTPVNEVDRTLLEAEGGLELRLDWHADLSKDIAFKTHHLDLLGRYGIAQTNEVRANINFEAAAPDGVNKTHVLTLEDEQAIVFDLLDVRAGVDVNFGDGIDTTVDVALGLPFKYRITNKIAIVGLERIIAIHTSKGGADSVPAPDFTLTLAGELQVIPKLVVIVRPQIFFSPDRKDADGNAYKDVSVEAAVQYTVASAFDIGFRLILDNLTPPSMPSATPGGATSAANAIDAREFAFYIRGRFAGK